MEFELSRLFEKEIHYHHKVEDEKRSLERQPDFNSIACYSVVDPRKYGFIDYDQLFNFMKKYNSETCPEEVNSILRRLNSDEDFKISFREFSHNISPMMPGFTPEGCISKPVDLDLPGATSDDPLKLSKFKSLLEHEGVPFRLEPKK